jgi:predicted nucleotidyltransferase
MNKNDFEIAKSMKAMLQKSTDLVSLKVFGSRARGMGGDDSDMDVYIEVRSLDRETREKILDVTWETGFNNNMVIAPIIVTTDEVTNTPLRSAPIIRAIKEKGIAV